ncbi:hypothetical protein HKX48_009476 [Thoreauomyces humboldtii]|nr:hypothetical protein HKX48_009476 [Thoreauomyces humboldtii]
MVLRDPDAVECLYYAYPLEEFEAKPGVKDGLGFSVRVGRSVFTADGMNVDLGADNLVWTSDDDYTRFVDKSLRERYERHPPAKDAAASGLPRRLLKEEMERKHLSVRGAVGFKNVVRFPRSWIFPSIMGPFHYLPFLQCYHGVVSFYHRTTGSIEFFSDDSVERAYDLEGGHGYIEKDHGLEFPINWIWLQSASFKEESGSSLLVSVADVPLISRDGLLARAISLFPFGPAVVGRFHFSGFLVALHHARTNTTHNLSLYTGSKIGALSFETLDDEEERLEIKFRDYSGNTEMTVSTRRPHGRGVPLPGPLLDSDKMALIVEESISVEINVKLERDGKIIFEDTGLIGGMEVVGDMASLLEGIWGLDTSPREDL